MVVSQNIFCLSHVYPLQSTRGSSGSINERGDLFFEEFHNVTVGHIKGVARLRGFLIRKCTVVSCTITKK